MKSKITERTLTKPARLALAAFVAGISMASILALVHVGRTVPIQAPGAGAVREQMPPEVPAVQVRIDTRSRPGVLRVSGDVRFRLQEGDREDVFRFRLMSGVDLSEATLLGTDGRTISTGADSVGGFGQGLSSTTVWELQSRGLSPDESDVTLRFAVEASGTKQIFHVDEGLAFASGLNLAWMPQRGSTTRATGRLEILTLPGHVAMATGHRTSSEAQERAGTYVFEMPNPITPAFAVGQWEVVESEEASVPVRMYLREPRKDAAGYVSTLASVMRVLEDEFGDYPYPEFAVVEVPNSIANAAGFGGVSLEGWIMAVGPSLGDELSLCFFAHEMAHSWWGNQVRSVSGQMPDGLLDEGLANYAAHQVIHELRGPEAATIHRRTGCPLLGWIPSALGYFAISSAGQDLRLDQLPNSTVSEWPQDNKMYMVWLELGRRVGPDRLRAALREIVSRHSGSSVSFAQVQAAIAAAAEVPQTELEAFFEQWLGRPGAPDITLAWSQLGDRVIVEVSQAEPAYQVDVPVRLYGRNGSHIDRTIPMMGTTARQEIRTEFEVWEVDLDPQYTFLHTTPDLAAAAEPLGFYVRAVLEDEPAAALELAEQGRLLVPDHDVHATCMFLEYGAARALMRLERWDEAAARLKAAAQCPFRRPDFLPFVYLRLAQVAVALDDAELHTWAEHAGITADAVAGRVTGVPESLRMLRSAPESLR